MDHSVCPDSLEKIFLKVEQEIERRAAETHPTRQKWVGTEAICDPVQHGAGVVSGKRHKGRQKGSISFSRLGQVTEDNSTPCADVFPTQPASPSQSSFYENYSIDSFVSTTASLSNDDGDVEDSMHVTQMHQIAGRPSITSNGILRRLSRSHSMTVTPIMGAESNLMIGVSVQESTSESTSEDGMEARSRRSSVHAPGMLPQLSSNSSIPGSSLLPTNWTSKVKDLMHKFRRKPI
ncbi:hypothetical protein BYT27DRAFT_6441028 [Phlegmacium glaucopus]|nr:hypothetical protein BYT27DRAFT_6441028 [Phlegmacium glaucopus]